MDKISEILNSVKERVSNPLIFSFLVSWLVYNWKIPVALIWFDEKQISANGCNSIFEFIEDEWKSNGYFWAPFGLAFLYTFVFPIVKNLISAFQTWVLKWGDLWNLNISKGGKVSVEKYISLLEIYDIKKQQLEQIINRENQTLESNKELHRQHIKFQQEVDRLNNVVILLEDEKKSIFDINKIYGFYNFSFNQIPDLVQHNCLVEIFNRKINFLLPELLPEEKYTRQEKYSIEHFSKIDNELILVLSSIINPYLGEKKDLIFFNLVRDDKGDMVGVANNGSNVEFIKYVGEEIVFV